MASQRARDRAYRALAESAHGSGTTVLRRRLIRLSARIWWHPYWSTSASSGPADRVALRGRAREPESGGPSVSGGGADRPAGRPAGRPAEIVLVRPDSRTAPGPSV
ncbi:hypothetical protein ABZ353_16305 [Streptomyces niveus]|uniref:hypothetical protein n=2 Tax=Streptomyces niveus TaxID=193462 RepID=UPI0033FF33C9